MKSWNPGIAKIGEDLQHPEVQFWRIVESWNSGIMELWENGITNYWNNGLMGTLGQ